MQVTQVELRPDRGLRPLKLQIQQRTQTSQNQKVQLPDLAHSLAQPKQDDFVVKKNAKYDLLRRLPSNL